MAIIVGIDEVGLGPNLGPFIVTATVWEVPGPPAAFDFWTALADAVTSDAKSASAKTANAKTVDRQRLVVCDSKQLFQPHQGLQRIERSALALAAIAGLTATSLRALRNQLGADADAWQRVPWLQDHDLELPSAADLQEIQQLAANWPHQTATLRQIACRIVDATEFNRGLDVGNKAEFTTGCHLALLRDVCPADESEEVLVLSDKHGGRNRYASALSAAWAGAWVDTVREGPEQSVYRMGRREIRFQPRAEALFPVAAASLIGKYLRELEMTLFNRFWQQHCPGLAPTQGYPLDARRYLQEITPTVEQLALPLSALWRRK